MADKGYIAQQMNALPADLRTPLINAFNYILDNFKIGTGARATNAQWYRLSATTPTSANTEFSISHGLPYTPAQLMQILPLDDTSAQFIPLQVSRTADAKRVYLKSTSTNALVTVLVE